MFTGIIQTIGLIKSRTKNRVIIEAPQITRGLKAGKSIAMDGVCLTVTDLRRGAFSADVMPETLKKTNLNQRRLGDQVNLELPLPATGCFEGHIVTGHVEGVGKIAKIQKRGNSHLVTVQIPANLTRYVVPKGSIALSGVSLTVIEVKKNLITVGIIPTTFRHTNFQTLKIGDKVNVETDVMAKYFEKWQQ